jgi:hypothetical protein
VPEDFISYYSCAIAFLFVCQWIRLLLVILAGLQGISQECWSPRASTLQLGRTDLQDQTSDDPQPHAGGDPGA